VGPSGCSNKSTVLKNPNSPKFDPFQYLVAAVRGWHFRKLPKSNYPATIVFTYPRVPFGGASAAPMQADSHLLAVAASLADESLEL
jgi:hypothetical protein